MTAPVSTGSVPRVKHGRRPAAISSSQGRAAGCCQVAGSERAVFRGDRILLLEVVMEPETLARLVSYREQYLPPRGR